MGFSLKATATPPKLFVKHRRRRWKRIHKKKGKGEKKAKEKENEGKGRGGMVWVSGFGHTQLYCERKIE